MCPLFGGTTVYIIIIHILYTGWNKFPDNGTHIYANPKKEILFGVDFSTDNFTSSLRVGYYVRQLTQFFQCTRQCRPSNLSYFRVNCCLQDKGREAGCQINFTCKRVHLEVDFSLLEDDLDMELQLRYDPVDPNIPTMLLSRIDFLFHPGTHYIML